MKTTNPDINKCKFCIEQHNMLGLDVYCVIEDDNKYYNLKNNNKLINNYIELENENIVNEYGYKYICSNMIDLVYQNYFLYPINKKVIEVFALLQDQYNIAPDGLPYSINKIAVIEYLDKYEKNLNDKYKKYIIKSVERLFDELVLEKANVERKKMNEKLKH